MYQHQQETFGAYTKHHISNSKGNAITLVPEWGATLLQIHLAGKPILDGYSTPEALAEGQWGKNVLLAPFPNRLRDGRYTHLGQQYQFSLNNAATANAIHGFVRHRAFEVTHAFTEADKAGIVCSYHYKGDNESYPFAFELQVSFGISDSDGFLMGMEVINHHHTSIPMGLGWHPYFQLAESVDEVAMETPALLKVAIDERMIPTGELSTFSDLQQRRLLKDITLDNCFYIPNNWDEKAHFYLDNGQDRLHYWQGLGERASHFVQLFTPPHRQSVAIEPMTCNVDAFNNGDGLVLLAPEETMALWCGVNMEASI